jgi:hypothetical protein
VTAPGPVDAAYTYVEGYRTAVCAWGAKRAVAIFFDDSSQEHRVATKLAVRAAAVTLAWLECQPL